MFGWLIALLVMQGWGPPRAVRCGLLIFFVGLVIVVTIYTLHVVITLPERTSGHYVQPHRTH